ncbi:HAD superfamily hydrolase (TIGR01458 family) [Actinoplanes octamycinicus]|uniref:HAD superfamily hydrolase (TIGR01458 family) n=1 Tax=Actinoplanes octamycinicus TaxID=135948 RepID=A0A7W7H424_9ACTN|nr:HAD hydrolase-like protein [Actinoplanes octamycinicus]MBB4743502.1 HAD superfamily hydrolase (TIGR01458 family) [Actinoplanes octamycinicus]GIE62512.1 hydrolase [Actinoplanes octamycinicus]
MESRVILLDLDGTLVERGLPVPGAAHAIMELRRAGHTVRVFTNTDSLGEAALVKQIRRMGIPVALGEVFTPVVAALRVLTLASRVLVLADRAVRAEFPAHGDPIDPTHVIVGDCRQTLSYPVLDAAFRAVRNGAELLALQSGRYFRGADGDHVDTGAIVAALEYATGRPARLLGKPSRDFLRLAAGDAAAGRLWVVGDDRTTDILMANQGGATSVQVRTGKFADQQTADGLAEPTHVIDSIADLPALVEAQAIR